MVYIVYQIITKDAKWETTSRIAVTTGTQAFRETQNTPNNVELRK